MQRRGRRVRLPVERRSREFGIAAWCVCNAPKPTPAMKLARSKEPPCPIIGLVQTSEALVEKTDHVSDETRFEVEDHRFSAHAG
jgi:hypothetical protein